MKRIFLPFILCLLTLFFALSSFISGSRSAKGSTAATSTISTKKENLSELKVASDMLYDSLHLSGLGLSREVMQYAFKGHQELADNGILSNKDIIAICDFSQPSEKKRLYIIDAKNYRVLYNTYVAHGRNSGLDYAEHFSNSPQSLQSSLGFYVTKSTYLGKHGLSLKLQGLEKGFNDNAESRAVVIHGAKYIGDGRAGSAYMGRSFGCPAVPQAQSASIINMLKNGSCLFIYHPTQKYLNASKLLNA